jgi:Protein of unknown function (DUF3303)
MQGFIVAESTDAKGIYTWLADWMEVCSFDVVPVVEDAGGGGDPAGSDAVKRKAKVKSQKSKFRVWPTEGVSAGKRLAVQSLTFDF